jgi:methyl-accepting chemotaxis protein
MSKIYEKMSDSSRRWKDGENMAMEDGRRRSIWHPGMAVFGHMALRLKLFLLFGVSLFPVIWLALAYIYQAWALAGLALLAVAIDVYVFVSFYYSMCGGFKTFRQAMYVISMGDLRQAYVHDPHRSDEIEDLMRELGNMRMALAGTVQLVQQSSDQIVQASTHIAQSSAGLSERVGQDAAALEESSAALEQTTATIHQTADSVTKASRIAEDNAAGAERGGEVMASVVKTMNHIQDSSKKIGEIISVIDGIAFQTNILALNAAVEAARAGEQGRGFAVVAGEVRALAQRSATAAREISELISRSNDEVKIGAGVVHQAGQAMQEIVASARSIKALMDEVATGAKEQNAGVSQVGVAVHEIDRNTQTNAAMVEQTASATNALRMAALSMAATVDELRVPGQQSSGLIEGVDIDAVIEAHRQWKVKLREAIERRTRVDVATLQRDDCCALGKWIYGQGQQHLAGRQTFTDLIERHKHFHRIAAQVGMLINDKQMRQAEDALAPGTPFAQATAAVVRTLSGAKHLGF